MKQVERVWNDLQKQELGSHKVELASMDAILSYVKDLSVEHLRNMKNLSNAGFDALQEAGDIEHMVKDAEGMISDFEAAAKDLGVDIPNQLKTASQDLNSITQGLKVVRSAAQAASKL
jgi:hypothetical protein